MEEITKQFFKLRDPRFGDFIAKLIPNIDKENIIGVRSPAMKKFSKQFAKSDERWLFIQRLPHKYLEENFLHAAVIPSVSEDIEQLLENIEKFLPFVDNWAVCDTLAPKVFKNHPAEIYSRAIKWLNSDHPYTVRFGLVTLLTFFLDDYFLADTNKIVASIETGEYYVNMAIAWYFSYALIKQYDATLPLFLDNSIKNRWVHNKSIQKAVESRRISDERKEQLKSLRRKVK